MAAPPEVTLGNLTGDWVMNKTLSDDADAVLALQGIGWLTRKTINYATLTLHIKQYQDEVSNTHIDIVQTLTGGIPGTTELRTLNNEERSHNDHLFGELKGRSRWVSLDGNGIDDSFLKEGWSESVEEGEDGKRHVESWVINEAKGWEAQQIWGFAVLDEKRYYVRRVVVKKGKEVMKVRLVYNWQVKK